MSTLIQANGSKWAGDRPDTLAALLQRLESTPLDPRFEEFGNFIDTKPRACVDCGYDPETEKRRYADKGPMYPDMPEAVEFWGNFYEVSAVFRIATDDPEVIGMLTAAIRANQKSPAYMAARAARGLA